MKYKDDFEYEEDIDTFYIYHNSDNEEVIGSILMGNFVYDVSISGKIVGLEIDSASKLFNVEPSLFVKAKNVGLTVNTQADYIVIRFFIQLANENYVRDFVIPRNKIPIMAS